MPKTRDYSGTVLLEKAYRGNKSLNLVLTKEQAINLARCLLDMAQDKDHIDLAVFDTKKTREGKIRMTVTSPVRK